MLSWTIIMPCGGYQAVLSYISIEPSDKWHLSLGLTLKIPSRHVFKTYKNTLLGTILCVWYSFSTNKIDNHLVKIVKITPTPSPPIKNCIIYEYTYLRDANFYVSITLKMCVLLLPKSTVPVQLVTHFLQLCGNSPGATTQVFRCCYTCTDMARP